MLGDACKSIGKETKHSKIFERMMTDSNYRKTYIDKYVQLSLGLEPISVATSDIGLIEPKDSENSASAANS